MGSAAARPRRGSGVRERMNAMAEPPRRPRHALTGVSRALLVSLVARHLENLSAEPLLDDPWSSELVARLGIDAERFARGLGVFQVAAAVRTRTVDDVARAFVRRTSNPVVVTLGAGLCTRCLRLADPSVRWYDLDLPNVAALRRELLPDHDRRTVLAASVLDPRWMDEVGTGGGSSPLFVAEGLLMHLEPDDVHALIDRLAERFPGAELIAEAYGPWLTRTPRLLRPLGRLDAPLRWSVGSMAAVADRHDRVELRDQWFVLDRDAETRRRLRLLGRVSALRREVKLGHFRFAEG